MKKIVLLIAVLGISCLSFSQEKKQSIVLGINDMQPNTLAYSPKIGFQIGYASEKPFSKAFSFQKEVYLSVKSFDYHEPKSVLNLKNTTYALEVPLSVKWFKPKFFKPYIGVAGIWNFNSQTKYYVANTDDVTIGNLEFAVLGGISETLTPHFELDLNFMGTPVIGDNRRSIAYHG
jgi:hypothetical protein